MKHDVLGASMADRTTITFHTTPETKARLDKLAAATRRSKSFLSNEAVEQYLAEEEAFIADVAAGTQDLDEDSTLTSEELTASLLDHIDEVSRTSKTA